MSKTAKVFTNGRSQAIRLPAAYRFDKKIKEVFIHQDVETGDVVLSRKPENWNGFFDMLELARVPANFLDKSEREQIDQDRDPFQGFGE